MSTPVVYMLILPLKKLRESCRIFWAYLQTPFFMWRLRRHTPVLVYQMGKVGSTSVYHALRRAYPGVVLHTHVLSSDHANPLIRRLYTWVVEQGNPLDVVSLIRVPMTKNVSGFFHNYERYTGMAYRKDASLDALRSAFLERYVHDNVLNWFDDHILRNFGLDVYAESFPEDGIATYRHGSVKLIVLRSEVDDRKKEQAIDAFLGLRGLTLRNRNIGSRKYYSERYRDFIRDVRLPNDYVERMASSKYFRHFYSVDEINAEVRRWCADSYSAKEAS